MSYIFYIKKQLPTTVYRIDSSCPISVEYWDNTDQKWYKIDTPSTISKDILLNKGRHTKEITDLEAIDILF